MPRFLAASRQHLDQARPAADRLDREAAPELELAVDLERLPAVDRDEADALVAHPAEGVEAAVTRSSTRSGSARYCVTRAMSSKNWSCGVGAEIGARRFPPR